LAPTSTHRRIELVATKATGFIYCVSLTGVTGARSSISAQLEPFVGRVRGELDHQNRPVPLAVGFGISTPAHVREVARLADGVIAGCALIARFHPAPSPQEGVSSCGELIREMRQALADSARAATS